MITFRADSTAINRAIAEIARYSGARLEDVVDHEAAKVIETAVRYTPAANVGKITRNSITGKALKADVGNGEKTYWMENRYPDVLWARLQAVRKERVQKKLKARGLTKQAFAKLALAAGLQVKAPAYAMRATPSNGRTYQNATGRRVRSAARYGLYFASTMPVLTDPSFRGGAILQRAMRGRVNFYKTNLKKGVFTDLRQISAKYPGIRIHPT